MTSSSPIGNAFLPTSQNFNLDETQLKIQLNKLYTEVANSVNLKENAVYDLVEVQNGEQFWNPNSTSVKRYCFRKLVVVGIIATNSSATYAHGITGATLFTHIYGGCVTAIGGFRSLPYPSVSATGIEIEVGATTITIFNGPAAPGIVNGVVILEYLKT